MQRITQDSDISYVVTVKELNEIRADERRKFAEWLQEKSVDNSITLNYGKFSNRELEDVLAEYDKE